MDRILVVGAGFSGAVIARKLAEAGFPCLVLDERNHVAGNCHTSADAATDILVHRYGPHIFHTDDQEIWDFVLRFGQWKAYRHAVHATVGGVVYPLPVNLMTINQFFRKAMSPAEARAFIDARRVALAAPANFRDQALSTIGEELYEAFFRHYTEKQWGVAAELLPSNVLKRLPLRFSYDSNYFHHRNQALPREGYTAIVSGILAHELIEVRLATPAEGMDGSFRHVFYTGGIDRYFGYRLGPLGYRTLRFEESRDVGDILGCPVMNFPDPDVPWTRKTEHRHLAPWRTPKSDLSIVWTEFSESAKPGDTLFYPLRLAGDERLLQSYVELANRERAVTFLGRLGCYAYIDMDVAIRRAIDTANVAIKGFSEGTTPPVFVHHPLGNA